MYIYIYIWLFCVYFGASKFSALTNILTGRVSLPLTIFARLQDSSNVTPLLFLLDQGCDPTRDIEAFADEMMFLDKLIVVESRASTVRPSSHT